MNDIRKLPAQAERVETGPTQFGEDWPGVFIRGDHAAYFATALEQVTRDRGKDVDPLTWLAVESLHAILIGAIVGPAREMFAPPKLRPTAPLPQMPSTPLPVPAPYSEAPGCAKCGMKFTGPLGYVCPQPDCPSGLGGGICMTFPAPVTEITLDAGITLEAACDGQDPVIGN